MSRQIFVRLGVTAVALGILFVLSFSPGERPSLFVSFALADGDGGDGGDSDGGEGSDSDGDSDGRDGDDGDDGDDDSRDRRSGFGNKGQAQGGGFRLRFPWQKRTQRRVRAPQAVVLPEHAPAEIVVSDITDDDRDILLGEEYAVTEVLPLDAFNSVLTRLSVPPGVGLEAARDRVRALASGQAADFNHYYRSEESGQDAAKSPTCTHENCRAWELIEWPHDAIALGDCALTVPVGMVDTGINPDHEIMATARLETIALADTDLSPSKAIHGTAVASLLVGDAKSRVPGLISDADLIAVDAFARGGRDERADLVSLLRALDLLTDREVRVINLSLAGPDNRLLAKVVDEMASQRNIIIVAAVGNAGPRAKPSFPAAYENVLAVTAVDAKGRIYRHAQRGTHVDVAAPGVNMLAATSIRGARLKSGTSFAVPFVTAAAGLIVSQNPSLNIKGLRQRLGKAALDLGAEGKDDIFGYGLISTSGVCNPPFVD